MSYRLLNLTCCHLVYKQTISMCVAIYETLTTNLPIYMYYLGKQTKSGYRENVFHNIKGNTNWLGCVDTTEALHN